jgi:hypothetical protein
MHAIPNSQRTFNPQDVATHAFMTDNGHGFFSDWQFATDILHPCDQEPIVQAGFPVTVRAIFDLTLAGADEVAVCKIDWDAEDLALQEFIDSEPAVKQEPTPLDRYVF